MQNSTTQDEEYPDINEAFWARHAAIRNPTQEAIQSPHAALIPALANSLVNGTDNAYANLQHRNVDNTQYGPTLGEMQSIKGDGVVQREMPWTMRGDVLQGSSVRLMGAVHSRNDARDEAADEYKKAKKAQKLAQQQQQFQAAP